MSDKYHQFVRCNLMSPVAKISVSKQHTTYTLSDGNVFKLAKQEMERFGKWTGQSGYRIRMTNDLKAQFPGDNV